MKYEVGDRVRFEDYTGTVIKIQSGEYDMGYTIEWDDERLDPSIVIDEQIEMIKAICETHGVDRIYSKKRDEYFCPFC